MTTAPCPGPPVIIECLPASYGDAILVQCHRLRQRPWTLLVDTGPAETWPTIRARLLALAPGETQKAHIDLLIISHVDHDHIGAAHHLLNDAELTIGDIWFNGDKQLDKIAPSHSIAEGQRFSDLLAFEPQPSWNAAFGNGPIVTPGPGRYQTVSMADDAPMITLLSPNPKTLTALARKWKRELTKPKRPRSTPSELGPIGDLDELASTEFVEDRSVANRSSIAVLLEHHGTSVALLADAATRVLAPALRNLAKDREAKQADTQGTELAKDEPSSHPLHLDAIKISHHGSCKNTSKDLLAAIQARHYLISTDGSRHGGHPNDETIARIITAGGKQPTIWFNHDTTIAQRWNPENLDTNWPYETQVPTDPRSGSILALNKPGTTRSDAYQ